MCVNTTYIFQYSNGNIFFFLFENFITIQQIVDEARTYIISEKQNEIKTLFCSYIILEAAQKKINNNTIDWL